MKSSVAILVALLFLVTLVDITFYCELFLLIIIWNKFQAFANPIILEVDEDFNIQKYLVNDIDITELRLYKQYLVKRRYLDELKESYLNKLLPERRIQETRFKRSVTGDCIH